MSSSGPHTCHICNKQLKTSSSLGYHIKMVHSDERPHECPYEGCDKAYKTKYDLRVHKNRIHKRKKPFACEICGKAFTVQYDVTKHVRWVHEGIRPMPYKCEWEGCVEKFTNRKNLRSHMTVHTGKKEYPCSFEGCGKSFETSTLLKIHYKGEHEREAKYACGQCTEVFKYHKDLLGHMKKFHKPAHKCNVCGKSLKTKVTLKEHMELHNENRTLVACNICGKGFTNMKTHVKNVHNKVKPFKCDICKKEFAMKGAIQLHVGSVHKIATEEILSHIIIRKKDEEESSISLEDSESLIKY
jgi:KRAB domain-containing zinc finger protein